MRCKNSLAATATDTLTPLAVQQADCLTFSAGKFKPSTVKAHEDLVAALEDMHSWEHRHRKAKKLLKDMLQSRSEAAELSKQHDIWRVPGSDN